MKNLELLSPAGSLSNLKAAISKKADAVYLGMKAFNAREFATNFDLNHLKQAVSMCHSNNVKLYLTMNTLVKDQEIQYFFNQLSDAYSAGIDSVIIQETSFLDLIKENYPDLRVHISTQAGVMNSDHANLLKNADRITLARELAKDEIKTIRSNYPKELEIFCHGALCVSVSGQCLFSSLLGGRSGNRGKCAQPCRKIYNNKYLLSTKELCLVDKIPEIIDLGVNSIKIEGRMRTPYYVATVTDIYKKAINSYYQGNFNVSLEDKKRLFQAFNREFTHGWFSKENVFNTKSATGVSTPEKLETYGVSYKDIKVNRKVPNVEVEFKSKPGKRQLLVRVYSIEDALEAQKAGADIIYFDLLSEDFNKLKSLLKIPLFGVTPRIMLDQDNIKKVIEEKQPAGILARNLGILNLNLRIPIHLDYNLNAFNDLDIKENTLPIISPELSSCDLFQLKNKNFAVLVHGKLRLMTLRHNLDQSMLTDERKENFFVNKIPNGVEILNGKEFGLLNKSRQLAQKGINSFFIDTDKNVKEIVSLYKNILNNKPASDSDLKKKYVLAWSKQGVI